MRIKDYERWTALKRRLNNTGYLPPEFHARQVWLCSIGENVGFEEDGKNEMFARPVVIIRKCSERLFFGVPLTSKDKAPRPYYFYLGDFRGRRSTAILSQAGTWDAVRLVKYMGLLKKDKFVRMKKKLAGYLGLDEEF